MSRHLGLIVGVNQYQDNTFRPLQFAENDARALAQWLVNSKGGKWSPPDVQLVQGQHATKELIESLITQICIQKAEPDDIILLYLAGHTFVDEHTGEGYFALTNSHYQDITTCLSLHSFTQNILTRSQAAHILLVLDCFQTGQMWNMRRTSQFDSKPLLGSMVLNTLQSHPNRLIMCSCRGNDYAPEIGDHNLGLLMNRAIIGLSGPAADSATGIVTLANLNSHLFNTLGEQQQPQLFGIQQTPMTLIGDLPTTAPQQNPATNLASSGVPSTPGSSTTGSLLRQPGQFARGTTDNIPSLSRQPSATAGDHSLSQQQPPSQPSPQTQQMLEQAQQLFQAQNYGEAFNLVEKVLQITPNDITALVLKGQLMGTAGRYAEAQAAIDLLLQVDPNNAMGWSMRAVVLSNMGQYQPALTAVERSLELDSQNPETYAIKNNIMASLATAQSPAPDGPQKSKLKMEPEPHPSGSRAFLQGLGVHILGLVIGLAGLGVLILGIPSMIGLFIASMGIAVLSVNAARGAFRNGFSYLLLTFIFLILIGGALGATYKVGLNKVIAQISLHPSILEPMVFVVIWLVAASVLPFILSIGGLIGGASRRRRAK